MATKRQKKSGTDPNMIDDETIILAMEKALGSSRKAAGLLNITPRQLRYRLEKNPTLSEECRKIVNEDLRATIADALIIVKNELAEGDVKVALSILSRARIWEQVQPDLGSPPSKSAPDKVTTKKADEAWEKFVKNSPKDKDGAIVVGKA